MLEIKQDDSGARTIYWKLDGKTDLVGFVGTDGRFRSADTRTNGLDRAKWGEGLRDQIRSQLGKPAP